MQAASTTPPKPAKPPTHTSRIIDYLRQHPESADSKTIANAIGIPVQSATSLCSQLSDSGRLKRTPTGLNASQGARFTYQLGDDKARFPTRMMREAQKRRKMARPPKPPTEAIRAELAILTAAKEVINGFRPSMAEKMDEAASDPLGWPQETNEAPGRTSLRWAPEPAQEAIEAPEAISPHPTPEIALQAPMQTSLMPILMTSMETIAATMADAILAQLNQKLAARVSSLSGEIVAGLPHPEVSRPTPAELQARVDAANTPEPEKNRLSKVVIVGLKPTQAGLISEEFSDSFELRFWSNEKLAVLEGQAKACDHVIVVLSGTHSHETTRTLDKIHVPHIKIPGGMTQLRNKLTELYTKDDDERKAAQ